MTSQGHRFSAMKTQMLCIPMSCVRTPTEVVQPLHGLNTTPPAAVDGQADKRRAMLFSPSPCFPFTVSYTAVSLNYLGHQLASRR